MKVLVNPVHADHCTWGPTDLINMKLKYALREASKNTGAGDLNSVFLNINPRYVKLRLLLLNVDLNNYCTPFT